MSELDRTAIDRNIAEGITFVRDTHSTTDAFQFADVDHFAILAKYDDDMPLPLPNGPLPPRGDTVWMETPRELAYAYESFGRQIGVHYHESHIYQAVQHELEHASAFRRLGATAVNFSFVVTELHTDKLVAIATCQAYSFSRPLTKLGMAASTVGPRVPSQGDMATLSAIGYAGPDDVAERIIAHNIETAGYQLPVPLSSRVGRLSLRIPVARFFGHKPFTTFQALPR